MEELVSATEVMTRASVIPASKDEVKASAEPPSQFINRELSWLRFNGRVLAEALDGRLPLLQRVGFLSSRPFERVPASETSATIPGWG